MSSLLYISRSSPAVFVNPDSAFICIFLAYNSNAVLGSIFGFAKSNANTYLACPRFSL